MKIGIGNIYLAWRKGVKCSRILIGVVRRKAGNVNFSYIPEGLKEAKSQGFVIYPDFPDEKKVYTENVLEILGQRLNKSEREDINKYYSYWEIDPSMKDDKYYLLAHTQGILPTDNFEFLADYNPITGLSFVSELCGLSTLLLDSHTLEEGDELDWKKDPSNLYDNYAVKVFKEKIFVGYIKRVHSRLFYKNCRSKIKITVKNVYRNGHLNRAFIKVSL